MKNIRRSAHASCDSSVCAPTLGTGAHLGTQAADVAPSYRVLARGTLVIQIPARLRQRNIPDMTVTSCFHRTLLGPARLAQPCRRSFLPASRTSHPICAYHLPAWWPSSVQDNVLVEVSYS